MTNSNSKKKVEIIEEQIKDESGNLEIRKRKTKWVEDEEVEDNKWVLYLSPEEIQEKIFAYIADYLTTPQGKKYLEKFLKTSKGEEHEKNIDQN